MSTRVAFRNILDLILSMLIRRFKTRIKSVCMAFMQRFNFYQCSHGWVFVLLIKPAFQWWSIFRKLIKEIFWRLFSNFNFNIKIIHAVILNYKIRTDGLCLGLSLQKKRGFLLRISSVNVTKSPGSCGFVHIYCRNT